MPTECLDIGSSPAIQEESLEISGGEDQEKIQEKQALKKNNDQVL